MRSFLRAAILLICATASLASPESKPAAEWLSLFNGKDISAWTPTGSAEWKVEDGVISGGQFGDPKKGGNLITKESFQDFELELEFQIDEHGKYNSGVYLRCQRDDKGKLITGYQVNIGRGAAGEYCGGVFVNQAWLAKGDEKDAIRKPNEWNRLRIVAQGAHLVVDLNGKNIVDVKDEKADPKLLKSGPLALQTYGAEGHAGWVKFRNLRIRPLSTK
jgi:hypothetical protein